MISLIHLYLSQCSNSCFNAVVGAIERVSSAMYGILFAGVCGVAGALVVLPVAIVKARKAREA